MKHEIRSEWQEDMHFIISSPGSKISIDPSEELGGKDKGARAKPLMLVSLAGCTGVDVQGLINKMRLKVDKFVIDISAELTAEHPKYYKSTHIVYNFHGADLNQDKLTKAVNLSFDKYCGVIEMFKQFSDVSSEIRFIEE